MVIFFLQYIFYSLNFLIYLNHHIIEKEVTKVTNENKEEELRREIEELKKKLLEKEEEITKLKAQNKEYEKRLKKIDNDCDMETEEHFRNQQDTEQVFIDSKEKEFHRVVCKIGEGSTSEAFKVVDTRSGCAMCKKILKDAS